MEACLSTVRPHMWKKMCWKYIKFLRVSYFWTQLCNLSAWWRHGKSLFVSDYWFCTHKVISFIGISWPTSYYDVVLCTLTHCNLWLIDRLEKAIMISKISSMVLVNKLYFIKVIVCIISKWFDRQFQELCCHLI